MHRISNQLAWGILAILAALAVLNWNTLMATAHLNLVVAQIEAPLGVVLLGVTGVVFALFLLAYMQNQISSLLETRRLLKEVQRVQELADKAEASRMENLHQLIATEFRLLNDRLSSTASSPTVQASPASSEQKPMSMAELMAPR